MNRLNSSVSMFAGLALAAVIDVPGVAADSVRVPIRSANARTRQFDPNANPIVQSELRARHARDLTKMPTREASISGYCAQSVVVAAR